MLLDRKQFLNCLEVLNVVGNNNKIMKEISDFIRFVVIDGERKALLMSATDFLGFIMVDYGDLGMASVRDVPSQFMIQASLLRDIVKNSTTETVAIEGNEDSPTITVTTNGTYKFRKSQDIDKFPSVDLTSQAIGDWDAAELQKAWRQACTAVSKDVTKVEYQGVNFDGNWASTDVRRLAVVKNGKLSVDGCLLPTVTGGILEACKGPVTIGLTPDKRALVVSCQQIGMVASIRLLDAKFIDYKAILDRREDYVHVTLPKQELLGAMGRLMCLTDKLYKVMTVTLHQADGKAYISLELRNQESGAEDIECIEATLPDEIGNQFWKNQYQIEHVRDGVVAALNQDITTLAFERDGRLWIDDGNFTYVVSKITSQ